VEDARAVCEHSFVTSQGSAYVRFRRALDRGNVTEALSAGAELDHVGLNEALELCLLLRDKAPDRSSELPSAGTGASAARSTLPSRRPRPSSRRSSSYVAERKRNAAFALADLLSRRGLERPCETLVTWGRKP
jgi:hypothetical protein